MTSHERDLFFETLELLRKTAGQLPDFRDADWKDIDDWVFSELSLTVGDIEAVYAGRDAMIHTGSAIEGPAPICPTFNELTPFFGQKLMCREMPDLTVAVVAEDVPGKPVLLTNGDCPELGLGKYIGQEIRLTLDPPVSGNEAAEVSFWSKDYDLLHSVSAAG